MVVRGLSDGCHYDNYYGSTISSESFQNKIVKISKCHMVAVVFRGMLSSYCQKDYCWVVIGL